MLTNGWWCGTVGNGQQFNKDQLGIQHSTFNVWGSWNLSFQNPDSTLVQYCEGRHSFGRSANLDWHYQDWTKESSSWLFVQTGTCLLAVNGLSNCAWTKSCITTHPSTTAIQHQRCKAETPRHPFQPMQCHSSVWIHFWRVWYFWGVVAPGTFSNIISTVDWNIFIGTIAYTHCCPNFQS